jgi:hypothetical protein
MLVPSSLISFASLLTLNHLSSTNASPAPQASVIPTGRTYYLKTKSDYPAFSNLYVEAYHTGAGFNDAVLVEKGSPNTLAATGFLNGTYQEFNLGDDFPWGMVMTSDTTYDAWLSVQINAGYGNSGFYFNNTDGTGTRGLKWVDGWPYVLAGSSENDWNGWLGKFPSCFGILEDTEHNLACNWAHGLPQLFWLTAGEPSSTDPLPCNCAKVELVREFTD